MKQLWKVEREERWSLYREFRQAADEYRERMGGRDNAAYFHPHYDDSGLGSSIVIDYDDLGHDSYVYLSVFSENESQGERVRSLRSFSVGRVHYAIRWRFLTQKFAGSDPSSDLAHSVCQGPTSVFGRRLVFGGSRTEKDWQRKLFRYRSFMPETDWCPPPGEQIEVRSVLKEAIGEISMLGFGTSQPLTQEVIDRHSHSQEL